MVMGVTPQEVAISAMVNCRASYIRWALPMRLAVILGLRPALVTAAAGGGEACLGVFLDESGFVFGHQGANMPKMSLPWAVVVSTVGQGLHADAAGFQGGDDVDQVAQVPAESVDFPDDKGVAGA